MMYQRPLPKITEETRPFWEGCRRNELRIQRCKACGRHRFYPMVACPYCSSLECRWEKFSGRGNIYTWTVVHRTVDPEWRELTPFVVTVVEPVEAPGVYLPGLLTGLTPELVTAGQPVEAWFDHVTPEISLLRWRPAAGMAPVPIG
jgi:uncharacterized OB-fold protein